jgi:hypothetical protein
MKEPLKIGIDVWRKEFIKWNESLVIPYDTPPIHVMVVSFYKYLEDKNKMENKLLEAHQQRVVDELSELNNKTIALNNFRYSYEFIKVDSEEQDRLIKQLDIMNHYRELLNERINNFK